MARDAVKFDRKLSKFRRN